MDVVLKLYADHRSCWPFGPHIFCLTLPQLLVHQLACQSRDVKLVM